MKIFIPTYNRPTAISTPGLLDRAGLDYRVVVHDRLQLAEYSLGGHVDPARLVVSYQPPGLCQQRQWILDQTEPGEWVFMADDNITMITGLRRPHYSRLIEAPTRTDKQMSDWLRPYPTNALSTSEWMRRVVEDTREAQRRGAWLVGYATNNNPYFRERKYRDVGYVVGKMLAVRKSHLRYDARLHSIDDFDWTAANLAAFGRVLINQWVFPVAQHYQEGGLGTYAQRLPKRLLDVRLIMDKWPGLFRYKVNPGQHPEHDLALRYYTPGAIAKWQSTLREELPIASVAGL